MAQKLETKIRKLLESHSVSDIVSTLNTIHAELNDIEAWKRMTDDEKTQWFYDQCAKYGFTIRQKHHQLIVNELLEVGKHSGTKAYMTVFLPREQDPSWHMEIGGGYASDNNGGIWHTHPGLKGKEQQIAKIVNLHNQGM